MRSLLRTIPAAALTLLGLLSACGEEPSTQRSNAAPAPAPVANAPLEGGDDVSAADAPPSASTRDLPPTRVLVASERGKVKDDSAYLIEPPNFELGVLEPNEVVELEFAVKNRSDRPFNIVYVHSECRCLTLEHDRSMIPPGGFVKLKARITATTAGQRNTAVTMHFSDLARSKPRVEFRYSVVPTILVEPKQLDLGRVEAGKSGEASLRVTLHLPDDAVPLPTIAPFVTHDLPIKLWMDEPTITPVTGGTRDWVTTLHARLEGNTPIPAFASTVVFRPNAPKDFRELLVPLRGEIVPSWYFERGVVGFGSVAVGEESEKEMRFFFPGTEAPVISKLESDIPGLELSTTLDLERHCYLLKLKLVASAAGKIEGTVTLVTALSAEPALLRVTARAK